MRAALYVTALALGLSIGAPANAQIGLGVSTGQTLISTVEGYTYFHRPGATLDDQRADLEACGTTVSAMEQPAQSSGVGDSYGLVGALIEAGIDEYRRQMAQRRLRLPHYENCMVLRGWRVVRVDDAFGEVLDALDQPSLAARLAPMVGSDTPEGEIARTFSNEAADGTTFLWGGASPNNQLMSLSLKALPPESPAYIAPEPTSAERAAARRRAARIRLNGPTPAERREMQAERQAQREQERAFREARERILIQLVGPGEAARPIQARNANRLPENATLLIVRVVGQAYGSHVLLMRPGAEEGEVDFVTATVPTAWVSGPKEQTVVAVVPAGHWRLSGFGHVSGYVTSFCMGAPSFDIAEGEVVFAGSFSFGAEGSRLDLNIEPALTALAHAPNLAARVRPASYQNGETFECGAASNFYSFEVPGAPFADDYRFGSRAHVQPAAVEPAAAAPAPAADSSAEAHAAPEPETRAGD